MAPAGTAFRRGRHRLSSVSVPACRRSTLGSCTDRVRFWVEQLVPASLLAPVDPAQPDAVGPRTGRDWVVDVAGFLLAVALGALFLSPTLHDSADPLSTPQVVVDVGCGSLACLSLWWRRRWPLGVALACALAGGVLDLRHRRRAPRAVLPRRAPQRPAGAARRRAVDPVLPWSSRSTARRTDAAVGGPGGHPARARGHRVGHVRPGPTPAPLHPARACPARRGRSAPARGPGADGRAHPDRARDARRARPPDLADGVARRCARGPARPAAGEGAGDRRAAALDGPPGARGAARA